MKRVCVQVLLVIRFAPFISALESDAGLLILKNPLPDDIVRDTFRLLFAVDSSQPIFKQDYPLHSSSVVAMWDESTIETFQLNQCSAPDLCEFSVLVQPLGGLGAHVITLLIVHQEKVSGISDTLDQIQIEVRFAEVEVTAASSINDAVSAELSASNEIQNAISIHSPRNLSSFLDPNNIHIAFEWHTSSKHDAIEFEATVEISGIGLVATSRQNATACAATPATDFSRQNNGDAGGARCGFLLHRLPPSEYAARISVWTPSRSAALRPAVAADVLFHVWHDHSWVTATTAHGSGLTRARAGERASFTIVARDWLGAPAEGAWFVTRLVGPAMVVPRVVERGGGTYEATYVAVRPPRATLRPTRATRRPPHAALRPPCSMRS
jgi:hypothetical protein